VTTEVRPKGLATVLAPLLRASDAGGDLPLPPICATIGYRFIAVDEGRAVMEHEPGEHQYNTIGTVTAG
jgi:acyl-coenzyme A thioesterase PaaI-like protein